MVGQLDFLGIGDLSIDIGTHRLGKGAILDPEHDLEVEIEAAEIEIGRTDVDRIVGDIELRVQPRRLIFENLDAALQEPVVGEACSRDGRAIIRLGRCHDAHEIAT